MILDIHESKALCEWLIERGLALYECAHVLCYLALGDTLCVALLNVFKHRETKLEEVHAKNPKPDWGNPIAY